MNINTALILSVVVLSFAPAAVEGVWAAKKGNTLIWKQAVTGSPEEPYRKAALAYNEGKWAEAAKGFSYVAIGFPGTSYGHDALFFLGVSYHQLGEFDFANDAFNQYLSTESNPQYFQEIIEYKFAIAEHFKNGEKAHVFGSKRMPKWSSSCDLAVQIYDEVILAMPSKEIGAKALYGKGWLLWQGRDYRGSIDAFQTLITRFPKHELSPESFLLINRVYLDQCQREFQNPDLLALAEINLQKFEEQFPGDEKLEEARAQFLCIKEVYAKGLYDTAAFYERIDQPKAAVIYYQKAIVDFPETVVSKLCRKRLSSFCPGALKELEEMQEISSDSVDEIKFI